ncbi:hypothetical protein ACHAQJ_004394 [Trichoderma viride]
MEHQEQQIEPAEDEQGQILHLSQDMLIDNDSSETYIQRQNDFLDRIGALQANFTLFLDTSIQHLNTVIGRLNAQKATFVGAMDVVIQQQNDAMGQHQHNIVGRLSAMIHQQNDILNKLRILGQGQIVIRQQYLESVDRLAPMGSAVQQGGPTLEEQYQTFNAFLEVLEREQREQIETSDQFQAIQVQVYDLVGQWGITFE